MSNYDEVVSNNLKPSIMLEYHVNVYTNSLSCLHTSGVICAHPCSACWGVDFFLVQKKVITVNCNEVWLYLDFLRYLNL